MIGHISGVLKDKTSNEVLVEAGGVGYEISLTMPAWFEIGELGDQVSVWCHLVVREDVQQLFGFRDKDERLMFRELIRISGIGPKVAQAILSAMDLPQLLAAIRDDQVAVLVKIPGIGKKTAERLVIELKDRLGQLEREVFGPTLHIIRYKKSELRDVLADIKASGYGLTLGIHSRIDGFAQTVFDNTQVGNTYINRNTVGAVVGVNPFGGQGLSGTGPKAGGPHYLYRFISEKTRTDNVVAKGGNTDLFTLSEG